MNFTSRCIIQSEAAEREDHMAYVVSLLTFANVAGHLILKIVRIFMKRHQQNAPRPISPVQISVQ